MSHRAYRLALGRVQFLLIPLLGPVAFAQETVPKAAPEPPSGLAIYEPGIMLIAATGILLLSVMIQQSLSRRGILKRTAWLMPILALLSGLVLAVVQVWIPDKLPNLRALVIFLILFSLFVSMLVPIARLILPSRELMTRAGVPPLLGGVGIAIVAFIGMFVLLSWTFPGLSFTPMFVTSGVVSLVVGLSLQDLLGNLMAGIVFGVERPFTIGDWVHIGDTEGEVVELTWRLTKLRTRKHDYVLIPNTVVARERVTNHNLPTAGHMCKIMVGVSYGTPPGIAVEALCAAARSVEEVLATPPPEAHFRDFLDSSLLYELRAWIDNFASFEAIEHEVRKAIWYSFKRHGITIPFPQRDVHFFKAPQPQLSTAARLIVTAGPLRGAMFPLGHETTSIGRLPECDVCVSDRHVSGHHATIRLEGGSYLLRDLNSRHGTMLNGEYVESATLEQGDEIKVGPVTLMFELCKAPEWGFISARSSRILPSGRGAGYRNIEAAESATETAENTLPPNDAGPEETADKTLP